MKKENQKKKRNKLLELFTKKRLAIISILLITLFLLFTFRDMIFCPYPTIVMNYRNKYNEMSTSTYIEKFKTYARDIFLDPIDRLNYSQLLEWEHRHLAYWGGELQIRPEMPIDILFTNLFGTMLMKDGTHRYAVFCIPIKSYTVFLHEGETTNDIEPGSWQWWNVSLGRCGEFALLYNGLLLANGYQSRIVVDCSVQTDNRTANDHVWNEIWINSTWVHIETTEACENFPNIEAYVNHPDMYANPDRWNKNVNLVYGIKGNEILSLTEKYR